MENAKGDGGSPINAVPIHNRRGFRCNLFVEHRGHGSLLSRYRLLKAAWVIVVYFQEKALFDDEIDQAIDHHDDLDDGLP